MLRGCNSEPNCLGRSPGTDLGARRDRCQCPAGPIYLLPPPGCTYISAVCFWRPVCLCFVFIPGQYFFWLLVACFSRPMLFSWASGVFGRWLELFSSPGVLFLSNWWLEYIQNMLPDSKYFPGDPVFFPRHLPVQALFAPPSAIFAPCCDRRLFGGTRQTAPYRPYLRHTALLRDRWRGLKRMSWEAHPSLFWCQGSAVVCGSASRLRGELVTVWAWAVCRLQ